MGAVALASRETRSVRRRSARSVQRAAGSEHAERAGSRGVGQERVSAIQRSRILLALVEVAAERGVAQASVAHIVARAGISRRTFYELFEDREDCFLTAFEHALARVTERVLPAYAAGRGWRERVRAGLAALLEFLDEEPGLGGLLIVDSLSAGPRALERRESILEVLTAVIEEGRSEGREGPNSPPLAAEGVVGAVYSVIHARILRQRALQRAGERRRDVSFLGLLNELMGMIVMPYLGNAAARRELARTLPSVAPSVRYATDPLRELDMRLTYRTIRVLAAIAATPGASNRTVAQHADVADQGQISKLLARLQHLGLVENHGDGPTKGEPNAWVLTAKGEAVEHTIRNESDEQS
jgi:AcrR family transcriptional regulator/DNA-binding MarR family transcriptional regulator